MTCRIVSQSNANRDAEVSAQRAAFVESIRQSMPDDPELLRSILQKVDTKMNGFHADLDKHQKINQPVKDAEIRRLYVQGPLATVPNLPMPDVDKLLGCAYIPANQAANHILALTNGVFFLRAGADADWMDAIANAESKYKCRLFRESHERVRL